MERISKTKSGIDRKKTIDALEWSLSVLSNQEIAAGSLKWSVLFVRTLQLVFFSHDGGTCYSISYTCDTGEEGKAKAKLILDDCVAASRRQIKPLQFVCDVPLNE